MIGALLAASGAVSLDAGLRAVTPRCGPRGREERGSLAAVPRLMKDHWVASPFVRPLCAAPLAEDYPTGPCFTSRPSGGDQRRLAQPAALCSASERCTGACVATWPARTAPCCAQGRGRID